MPLQGSPQPLVQLLDILDELPDLPTTLQQVLRLLIDEMGCQGGVIFIIDKKPVNSFRWFSDSIPATWQNWILTNDSILHQTAAHAVQNGGQAPADLSIGLAGGIVFAVNHINNGGVLFYHPTEIALPLKSLRQLARVIALFISRSHSLFANAELYNANFCDLVTTAQNIYLGLQEIQMRVADGIQHLVEPDGINMFLYYPEKDHLVEKTLCNPATGRVQQSVSFLKPSLLEKCLKEKRTYIIDDLTQSSVFKLDIDGIEDVDAATAMCIPMVVNNEAVGAVELLFTQLPEIPEYRHNMLTSIVSTLGFSIVNTRHIQQLRIANADVEANRWEIIRSRNILRALFDSLPFSIYIIDRTSKIAAINISRANRVGIHPVQLVGKKCYEALYNRNETCPGCLVNETLFTGVNTSRQNRIWVDDQPVEWEINTFAVLNDNNQPGQAIIIEQDVTEKRRLEANLIQSEKLAAVGQLAAGVVHEINNPLTAIIANAQILARELADDPDKLESVKLIELAGGRASQVVQSLLGFARKENYDFKPTDLNDTIQNAIKLLQHKLVAQSVPLKQDLAEDMPMIQGSRDHLEGVWVNLIINALDAMKGQEGKLALSSRFVNNEFRVTIADNGQGIPPEKISHIFEPFYTTKGFNQGTGLGLSICHRIVKNHGGYITVDSQIGLGTKFTIVLPGSNRSS
jgi:signal transduction histidine kinase/GAF domain-containing protein